MKKQKQLDLTQGSIARKLLLFSLPFILGNLLQQLYNVVDTLVVGRFLGEESLAAVGTAYTLMIFVTSIIYGLCMGSGVFFAIHFGRKEMDRMRQAVFISFVSILIVTVLLNVTVYLMMDKLCVFMKIPSDVLPYFLEYINIVFLGILATFLYNYFANLLRAVGNSIVPLIFMGISTIVNIILDFLFILKFNLGVSGAAIATVIAQYMAGIGILLYYVWCCRNLRPQKQHRKWDGEIFHQIANLSFITCIQQSVMNLGILLVQGLVNSFGTAVMAAFAAGVKIDTLAYAPAQDFGNAFSTFIAQNYGAGKTDRIKKGIKIAGSIVIVFCIGVSVIVFGWASQLMAIFVKSGSTEIISIGTGYLRMEGACYVGIGILFLLYGYYRAIKRPGMSLVLTILSLGTRVVLAYLLSSVENIGVFGIWIAIPIGWILADTVGIIYYRRRK